LATYNVGQPGGPTADISQKYGIACQKTSHVIVLAGNNNNIIIIQFIAIAVKPQMVLSDHINRTWPVSIHRKHPVSIHQMAPHKRDNTHIR